VADPDQAWILGELIRYLEHPKSGAMAFDDMGSSWVTVRDSIRSGTLRATDVPAAEVVTRFDALMNFTALQLGRKLGTEVVTVLSRRELAEPQVRLQTQVNLLADSGSLTAAIRIPDTVGTLNVTADLRANQIICHIDVDAPREGRGTTRVGWLVRQLRNAPATARVDAFYLHARGTGASELVGRLREDPKLLLGDGSRELKSFRVAHMVPMGPSEVSARARSSTRSFRRWPCSTRKSCSTSRAGHPRHPRCGPSRPSQVFRPASCRRHCPRRTVWPIWPRTPLDRIR
jgi:hypothetical protein